MASHRPASKVTLGSSKDQNQFIEQQSMRQAGFRVASPKVTDINADVDGVPDAEWLFRGHLLTLRALIDAYQGVTKCGDWILTARIINDGDHPIWPISGPVQLRRGHVPLHLTGRLFQSGAPGGLFQIWAFDRV